MTEEDLELEWGNYSQGKRVYPVRRIKYWRRAQPGDRIVVACSEETRRFFVLADDPEVGIRMPYGSTIEFDDPIFCCGEHPSAFVNDPAAYWHERIITIYKGRAYKGNDRWVSRLMFKPRGGPMTFIRAIHAAQLATVRELPVLRNAAA